jgi:hypothetical protein
MRKKLIDELDCGLYTAVDSHSISETGIQRRYKKDFFEFVRPE